MAQFRGTLQDGKGSGVSKLGHKPSGLVANLNGWHGGVCVVARWDEEYGDSFDIYSTGGSDPRAENKYIGTVGEDGIFFWSNHPSRQRGLN